VRPEGLGKLEKIYLIGTRSLDLPVCSLVPQPLRYRVPLDLPLKEPQLSRLVEVYGSWDYEGRNSKTKL
jgi:hypothetical protein